MTTNIIWKSGHYHSQEHCVLSQAADGNTITATINGHFEKKIYEVSYTIRTNEAWEVISVVITSSVNAHITRWQLKREREQWLQNGEVLENAAAAIDIDISLTPFTNTLPIRRLQLQPGQQQVIQVIYFDILQEEVKTVKQIYTCLSAASYRYEDFDKNFQALLRTNGE